MTQDAALRELTEGKYKYGFVTDVETDQVAKGLSEDVIRLISQKKDEPDWMLEWRLKAYRHWLTMTEPRWPNVHYPPIDYQDIVYYSAPKPKKKLGSMDEVDPELRKAFEKLGHPARGAAAARRTWRSTPSSTRVSVATTFKEKLAEKGVIFCSFSEAVKEHPELVQKYLGSVVPYDRQLLRGAQLGGLLRRLLRLHPEGRALPDGALHLLPDQRLRHRPVRADAHRRRRGRLRLATSRAAPRRCATRTSCTPRWSSWSRSTARRSSTRPCRTGTRATPRARAASTTSSPSAARRWSAPRSAGRRWRPAPPSPGSTRRASCRATTAWASSTPSRSRTTASRPTPARR